MCGTPRKHKKATKRQRKTKFQLNLDGYILNDNPGGGKAGKPYFIVYVGDVDNLYKTTKKPCRKPQYLQAAAATIDLHGYTTSEALDILNESLPNWIETAMMAEYPWVMQVKIVCGCGNQVLSEAVQEWIKSSNNVRNAPKNANIIL